MPLPGCRIQVLVWVQDGSPVGWWRENGPSPGHAPSHERRQCWLIGGSVRTRVSHLDHDPFDPLHRHAGQSGWSGCIRTECPRWHRQNRQHPGDNMFQTSSIQDGDLFPSKRDWLSRKKLANDVKSRVPTLIPQVPGQNGIPKSIAKRGDNLGCSLDVQGCRREILPDTYVLRDPFETSHVLGMTSPGSLHQKTCLPSGVPWSCPLSSLESGQLIPSRMLLLLLAHTPRMSKCKSQETCSNTASLTAHQPTQPLLRPRRRRRNRTGNPPQS